MKKQQILYIVCVAALASGCNVYRPYSRPDVDTKGLYRDTLSAVDTLRSDTLSFGNLPWEQVFTDPRLQALIRTSLYQNSDLQTAMLKVKEAEAGLMSARLAYTPSLNLAPQGGVSSFDKGKGQWTYQLPAVASWEIDLFGRLLNSKRNAKATLMQTEAYKQAVQTQVIAAVANCYYTLLMLDRQLAITEETSVLWKETVETMRSLKENSGGVNEAAVVQSEANSYMLEASIPDLKRQIRETENSLCLLLHQAPQHIERGRLDDQSLPSSFSAGVPVQMLANRPDVKASEMALAGTFYNTNAARAAFYPQLTLSGTFGWTNSAGSMIVNPGKMIAQAVGSLTAPIFNRGANLARLRVAKAQQQEALIAFQQSLLSAGAEVSDALYQYQSTGEKLVQRAKQISSLEKSVDYTKELLTYGEANYLEVLTAQQSLLSARISGITDQFQRIQAVVNLYHSLGGGRTE